MESKTDLLLELLIKEYRALKKENQRLLEINGDLELDLAHSIPENEHHDALLEEYKRGLKTGLNSNDFTKKTRP